MVDTSGLAGRYVFTFHEVLKPDQRTVDFHTLHVIEVDTSRFTLDELRSQLRPWALGVLRKGRYELGLYCADFSMVGEDGAPGTKALREEYIAWAGDDGLSGSAVILAPVPGDP